MSMTDDLDKTNKEVSEKIKYELLQQLGALEQVGMSDTPQYQELREQYEQFENGATLYEVIGQEFNDVFSDLVAKLDDDVNNMKIDGVDDDGA